MVCVFSFVLSTNTYWVSLLSGFLSIRERKKKKPGGAINNQKIISSCSLLWVCWKINNSDRIYLLDDEWCLGYSKTDEGWRVLKGGRDSPVSIGVLRKDLMRRFLKSDLCVYFIWETEKEREIALIHWSAPQMPIVAKTGQGQSQDPEAQSGSPCVGDPTAGPAPASGDAYMRRS